MEERLGLFASTLAAVDKAEVGDHLSLVLLVSELPQDDERLLEVLKRRRDAGMGQSESEVVERQCLGAPVTEVTHDGERGAMLFGCQLVIAFASKQRSVLVEPARLLLRVFLRLVPAELELRVVRLRSEALADVRSLRWATAVAELRLPRARKRRA